MKTKLLLSAVLALLLGLSSHLAAADGNTVPDNRYVPLASAPVETETIIAETISEDAPAYAVSSTTRVIAALAILALLGMIAFWLTKRRTLSAPPSGNLYPENGVPPDSRSDSKVIPVP